MLTGLGEAADPGMLHLMYCCQADDRSLGCSGGLGPGAAAVGCWDSPRGGSPAEAACLCCQSERYFSRRLPLGEFGGVGPAPSVVCALGAAAACW